jgi:hypothetical protein
LKILIVIDSLTYIFILTIECLDEILLTTRESSMLSSFCGYEAKDNSHQP